MHGIVDRLAPEGGFGFIHREGEEFFFHRSALTGVEFEVASEAKGDQPGEHLRAVNVHLEANEVPATEHERKIA